MSTLVLAVSALVILAGALLFAGYVGYLVGHTEGVAEGMKHAQERFRKWGQP